jgi:hypothetical protein
MNLPGWATGKASHTAWTRIEAIESQADAAIQTCFASLGESHCADGAAHVHEFFGCWHRPTSEVIATLYRNLLKVQFPACEEWDNEAWTHQNKASQPWPIIGKCTSRPWSKVVCAKIFEEPEDAEGRPCYKGYDYVGAVMSSNS